MLLSEVLYSKSHPVSLLSPLPEVQVIDADEAYIKELFTNAIQIGDVESGLVTIANGAIEAATISAD